MAPSTPPVCDSDYLRFCLSDSQQPEHAVKAMTEQFEPLQPVAMVIFAGANLQQIVEGLEEQFPGCPTMGCSTAGEISEGAFTKDTVSAFALGSPAKAAIQPVENLTEFRYGQGAEILDALCSDMNISRDELVAEPKRFVLIILADGLSGMEEVLIASLLVHVPEVKLVGGSAGDNFAFQQTQVACAGKVHTHGAVVMLLEPGITFRVFAGHHYSPTDQTVVVTSADPEKRLIHRIDGKPAHQFVAQAIGITTEELANDEISAPLRDPIVFGIKKGESELYYNRTVMRVVGTSLLMGGAMEEGTILTLMRPMDLLDHAKRGMVQIRETCERPIGQVLFDCGGRLGLAREVNQTSELAKVIADIPTAGFTTYGEFFGPLLLNHTLAGIIFDGSKGE